MTKGFNGIIPTGVAVSKLSASRVLRRVTVALLTLVMASFVSFGLLRSKHAQANTAAVTLQDRAALKEHTRANYAVLPISFEPNQGQAAPGIQYVGRGKGYKLSLTRNAAMMEIHRGRLDGEVIRMIQDRRLGAAGTMRMLKQRRQTESNDFAVVQMKMVDANPEAQLVASEQEPGKINYLVGKDRANWHSNIPLFGSVKYTQIYKGVDLAFHGADGRFEFDYFVSPNSDPAQIALKFEGTNRVRTTSQGDLVLSTSAGDVELLKPVAYQVAYRPEGASRESVRARFAVNGDRVSFELGPYDRRRELVIDPTMTYSTYFGGSLADYGLAIAVDGSGNEFVAGATDSSSVPGDPNGTGGGYDVFLTKFSPQGVLAYTTIFGGSVDEFPGGIAIDSQGIYIAGTTDSSDFPTTSTAPQPTFQGGGTNGNNDAFAAAISLDGTTLNWATYIGGSDSDSGLGVAVDGSHNVYVAGETFSSNLPVKNALPSGSALNLGQNTGDDDGYIAVVNSTGTAFNLVSYIGGSNADLATGIALDGSGNAYVSGITVSTDLPVTTGVVQGSLKSPGIDDAFVFGIKASALAASDQRGSSSVFAATATPKSEMSGRRAFALWMIVPGLALVSISIGSGGSGRRRLLGLLALMVVLGAFLAMPACGGSSSTSSSGGGGGGGGSSSAYIYGTYFGGSNSDEAFAIAADSAGNVFIVGQTQSTDFPVSSPTFQKALGTGGQSAFLAELNSSGTAASYATYLGGNGIDSALSVTVDGADVAYITGQTRSSDFPTANATQGTFGGSSDAFVSVLDPGSNTLVFSTFLGGSGDEDQLSGSIALDSSKNMYVSGDTDSGNGTTTPFPTVSPFQGTWTSGGSCTNQQSATVPCPDGFITAFTAP